MVLGGSVYILGYYERKLDFLVWLNCYYLFYVLLGNFCFIYWSCFDILELFVLIRIFKDKKISGKIYVLFVGGSEIEIFGR